MGVWSIIKLEGYCMFRNSQKKKTKTYELIDIKKMKFGKGKVQDNPVYNPQPRPKWCKKKYKGNSLKVISEVIGST